MVRCSRRRISRTGRIAQQNRLWLESLEDRRMMAAFTITNLNDGPVSAPGDLPGSLRQAIYDADTIPGADEIVWQAGLGGTITLTEGELRITDDVSVTGLGNDQTTIDAAGSSRIFNISDESPAFIEVSLNSIRVSGGLAHGYGGGGGIWNSENLTVTGSVISGNSTAAFSLYRGDGGGIHSSNGNLTITNSSIIGNSTGDGDYYGGDGGGIFASNGSLTITGSTITGNSTGGGNGFFGSGGDGGGIYSRNGSLMITGSTITGNSTGGGNRDGGDGGGIHSRNSSLMITGSTITGNSTGDGSYYGGDGGGIHSSNGNLMITNSTITGNSTGGGSVGGSGGGILFSKGSLTITRTTISDNSTAGGDYGGAGGGIRSSDSSLTITNSTITGNSGGSSGRGGSGGGIHSVNGNLTITGSTISDNSTGDGFYGGGDGGGISALGVDVTITNSTITGNSADGRSDFYYGGDGGGIHSSLDGSLTIINSTISGNSTGDGGSIYGGGNGGGIWVDDGPLTTENSIVAGNTDTGLWPDLRPGTGTLTLSYSLIGDTTGSGLAEAPVGSPDANGNLIGGPTYGVIDPLLGPIADNGGPTLTRALLSGSPAIDAGDASALAGIGATPLFDQRDSPFIRVLGGRIDIGSYEFRPATVADGDFNDDSLYDCLDIDQLVAQITAGSNNPAFDMTGDGLVNLADRDAWLAEAGEINLGPGKFYLLGDANLDGLVDGLDFVVWNTNKFSVLTVIPGWCQGNFNADAFVDGLDFTIWNDNKFQSSDSATQIVSPEPPSDVHEMDETNHVQVNEDTILAPSVGLWGRAENSWERWITVSAIN